MRLIRNGLFYLMVLGVAGYAVFVYSFLPLGSLVHPEMKVSFMANKIGVYSHIFASSVALVIGPLQFSTKLRQKHTNIHRWLGRVYLGVGILIGGVSGLYISQFAFGGLVAKLGFASLALLWLYTGLSAYLAVRRGDISEHRKWMIRNFSLTLAAVTLRIYLPASMVAGFEFTKSYMVIAWLCWVPNIVFAEWRLRFNIAKNKALQQASG